MQPALQPDRRGSLDQESEMLPQDPPARILRGIGWLIIALFAAILAGSIFIRMPETVKCPFVLVPADGADPIQAPSLVVVSAVRVTEGQEVTAGQELFVLHSEEIQSKHTQLQTLTEDLHAKEDGVAKMEASHILLLGINDAEAAQVEREITFRQTHAETSRNLLTGIQKLARNGAASQVEVSKFQLDLAASEKDLSVTEKNLNAIKLERQRLETERSRLRIGEQADMQNLKTRMEALQHDLENSQGDLLSIRAPYAAVVISVTQRNGGNVVQSGQELCQLARLNAPPRARLLLQESGLSRITIGQHVRLFFDAFPYQRYGTVMSRLDWISPAAVSFADARGFIAAAALDQASIRVENEPRPLRVGMKGEARIVVGSRALIEYAFEPIRQLRENTRQ